MLLAIDVGNTNTVLGVTNGVKPTHTWRVSTHPLCTADEFRVKLESLLQFNRMNLELFDAVVVSSVVPSFTAMLRGAFKEKRTHFIDSKTPFSFSIKANPANQVGADRLVNAEAVVREYGAPAIVVDSGTATTICAIGRSASGEPEYRGGAIMPGIELSIETLARRTAKLFAIELTPPEKVIGANTQEALQSGVLFGYASMIDGMVARFKKELGGASGSIPVVATGGVVPLLKGLTTSLDHFDPDLTLKGIAYLAEHLSRT